MMEGFKMELDRAFFGLGLGTDAGINGDLHKLAYFLLWRGRTIAL